MHDQLPKLSATSEAARLETLHEYEVLDTDQEQAFDDLAALASYICETPISAISLVDNERQWFKASVGLDVRETPRDISFCQHTIHEENMLVVPDAQNDPRFKDSPLVNGEVGLRFYAGAPLIAPDGSAIGALCVKDTKPRQLTDAQKDALKRLARQVIGQLELRKTNHSLERQTKVLESYASDLKEANSHALRAQFDAQEALQSLTESEERFRAFAENASDAFYMHDMEGNILYVNRSACEASGYSEEELLGMKIPEFSPDLDAEMFKDLCEALPNGQTHTFNGTQQTKNGDLLSIDVRVRRFELRGKPMFFAIARDQTDQLRTMEKLRRGEERFDLVCLATNDMVWDLDVSTGTTWISPSYEKLFGAPANGTSPTVEEWLEAIHPDDRDRVRESFRTVLTSGAPSWQQEYRHLTATGEYADVLDRAFVIFGDDNKPIRVLGAISDLTERKQAEQDRIDREQAERANHAKSQFLSRMSHELRTPLNSILGFAQLLEMYQPTDQQKECIGRIMTGGKHLLGLINEVLDLSRIESGNMEISREPVCIDHVVEEAISLTQPLARTKKVTVEKESGTDPELFTMADRQRLLQVIINLISNGVKYNVDGGSVYVSFGAHPNGRIGIQVRDTGKGIGKELAHRVFMPFDRLGIEQSSSIEGTGLGLALSKSLVDAMDGQISFTSKLGEGTTFNIELAQASKPAVELQELTGHTSSTPSCDKRRLIYIEDNESNVALMRSVVSSRPHWSVEVATTGNAGLKLVTDSRPDLLLLDLDLPDVSGYEVLMRLRSDVSLAEMPILIVSADATKDRIDRLLAAGASGYITKPFDVRDLLHQISDHLDGEAKNAA